MAREFLPMGFTRARRYANYTGGQKYDPAGRFANAESPGRALRGRLGRGGCRPMVAGCRLVRADAATVS
jgi:hypothetical protein